MNPIELAIDVTGAADLGEPATVTMTVHLPDPDALASPPIVAFAKPGALFARGYFTTDLPGPASGAQGGWHAERGWIFVAVDPLGVGGSSTHDMTRTGSVTVARAAHAAEQVVLGRLAEGTLVDGFPAIADPLVVGLGQSMGGCLTVVQQAHHRTYNGIGVLGYGVVHSRVPAPPGIAPIVQAWRVRDAQDVVLNATQFESKDNDGGRRDIAADSRWCFFHDDVDPDLVHHGDPRMPWASATVPGAVLSVLTPGVVASEAAAIDVPVLVAMGERDIVADPPGEVRAYLSAPSVDLYMCPRMGHMHNFASTRQLLWRRIDTWAAWVAAQRAESRAG
jgi:pimeloyl-ACP methyl ester carboxylesterase